MGTVVLLVVDLEDRNNSCWLPLHDVLAATTLNPLGGQEAETTQLKMKMMERSRSTSTILSTFMVIYIFDI